MRLLFFYNTINLYSQSFEITGRYNCGSLNVNKPPLALKPQLKDY